MSVLKGLNAAGRVLVKPDFQCGTVPTVDAVDFVTDLQLGRMINLAPLHGVVSEAMTRFEFEPSKSDSWLGPRVHATLRLTRREAADKRIWEYLTIVEFPNYTRWRWAQENPEDPVPLMRFAGSDHQNAVAKLWWGAEVTRNGPDYSWTTRALNISRFSVSWLKLNFLHHRSAALAAVDFLSAFGNGGATGAQGQVMAKAVNIALRTVSLDALASSPPTDSEAVRQWLAEKIDETTMIDELPKGPDESPVPEADIAAVRSFLNELAERIRLSEVKGERKPAPVLPGME